MFNFRPIGLAVQSSNNITMDNNVIGNLLDRTTIEAHKYIDRAAGFAICSLDAGDVCKDLSITNNIVGGAVYAGFIVSGHKCGEAATQKKFRGNVAHSIYGDCGTEMGHGYVAFPDPAEPDQKDVCFEASHFSAYKCKR